MTKEKGATFECLAVASNGQRTTFHVIEVNSHGGVEVLLAAGAAAERRIGRARGTPSNLPNRGVPYVAGRTISIQSSSRPHSSRACPGATVISARGGRTVGSRAIADR